MSTERFYNVTIETPFRNNERHIDQYIQQAEAIDYPPERLRWVLVEGDSEDNTLAMLDAWAHGDRRRKITKCDTGKPHYGSIVHPERFATLARVFNHGLEVAIEDDWADYVWFIPSDVIYKPDTLRRLLSWEKDVISPMFWIGDHQGDPVQNANGMRFYDVWGFIREGRPFPPYGPAWYAAHYPQGAIEMETTGGMMLMRADVPRAGCRHTAEDVDHGLCVMAREAGFEVWCDTSTHIVHGER